MREVSTLTVLATQDTESLQMLSRRISIERSSCSRGPAMRIRAGYAFAIAGCVCCVCSSPGIPAGCACNRRVCSDLQLVHQEARRGLLRGIGARLVEEYTQDMRGVRLHWLGMGGLQQGLRQRESTQRGFKRAPQALYTNAAK